MTGFLSEILIKNKLFNSNTINWVIINNINILAKFNGINKNSYDKPLLIRDNEYFESMTTSFCDASLFIGVVRTKESYIE